MKWLKTFLILVCLTVMSCADKYEQEYHAFSDFDKASQRNKGWFPDFVSTDAYDLKNVSFLDSLCAFGEFSYSNDHFYDSIFNKPINKIDIVKFEQKVNEHLQRRPKWFLNADKSSQSNYQAIQQNRFYIVRHPKDRKIYFVLSN